MSRPPDSAGWRCVQLAALGSFALPFPWSAISSAGFAAAAEVSWPAAPPKTPLLVLAAAAAAAALEPAGSARLARIASDWNLTVGPGLLWSPGTLALILACAFAAPRRAGAFLALHLALGASFVVVVEKFGLPQRIDEPTALLWVVLYRGAQWVLVGAGLLWSDQHGMARRRLVGGAAALLGLFVTGLALFAQGAPSPTPRQLRIAFLWPPPDSEAAADYRRADSGHGFHEIGLYGEWPRVLERAGHAVARVLQFDNDTLGNADLAIMASAFRPWRAGERERLTAWVQGGGRLLVVGEHSDLDDCQERLNPLLAPFGLELNFDTSNGLLGDGLQGVSVAPGAFRRLLHAAPLLPYNRGGSISLGRDARPLAVGRYWHADAGDALAPERAFLSDYRLSRGDRLGDVVLMALHEGRGRVLLVGDSTPFLNQNTVFAAPFLLGLPHYLAAATRSWPGPVQLGVLAAVAVGFAAAWRPRLMGPALGVATLAGLGVALRPAPPLPPTDPQGLAVVSVSENNVFDRDPFSGRAPTALGLAFTRLDMTPTLGAWELLPHRPAAIAILNPARAPAFEQLLAWVREGTTVILSGAGDNPYFRNAARALGVEVSSRPLGSLKGRDFTTYSAWEVTSAPADALLLSAQGFTVGAVARVASGRAVVIADSEFLLSRNLESEAGADELNVAFVRRLLGGLP